MIHNAGVPLGIFPGRVSVLTPFKLNSEMKIAIILFSSNISKPVTAQCSTSPSKTKTLLGSLFFPDPLRKVCHSVFLLGRNSFVFFFGEEQKQWQYKSQTDTGQKCAA